MDNLERVLQGLLRRTQEGKLKWRTTVDENRFLASVDTIGVAIQSVHPRSRETSERFKFEVLNENGITVETLGTQEPPKNDVLGLLPIGMERQNENLSRLFTLARRSALDSESTLAKLADRLESLS